MTLKIREIANGEQITEAGVYIVPIDRYHNDPDLFVGHSVSSTGLRSLSRQDGTPAKYWRYSVNNPDRIKRKPSDSLRFGKGVHAYLLENNLPEDEFAISPFEDFSSNEGHKGAFTDPETKEIYPSFLQYKKAWKADKEAREITILTEDDIATFKGMAEALSEDPLIQSGLLEGLVEHTIAYQDPATGIWVKVRPDVIPSDDLLGDYKTTKDASGTGVAKAIAEYAYHQQLALTVEAIARVFGREISTSFLVAQEKTEGFDFNIAPISQNAIWWGMRQNRLALDRLKWCIDNDRWPRYARWTASDGYVEGPQDVDLPDWYEKRLIRQDELEGIPDVKIENLIGEI